MTRFVFSICLTLNTILISYADLPLFENQDIHTIHMIKEMESVMKKDGIVYTFESPTYGTLRGGEKTKWVSMYIDVKSEQISVRWVDGKEKPQNFNQPDQIRLYTGKTYYDVSNTQKRTLTDTINFRQLTSYFALGGWFHDGISLSQEYNSTAKRELKEHEDGMVSFWLNPLLTKQPVEVFVNPETERVMKVVMLDNDPRYGEGQVLTTTESYEWAKADGIDFWYPRVIHTQKEGVNGITTESKLVTHDIAINPQIPIGTFNTNFPETYQQIDRSKLLKRPNF